MTWSTLKVKYIQSCFFDLEIPASTAPALMFVPRGGWPSPEYGWLVSPPPTLHLLLDAKGSWGKGTRPRSDRGIRMERSAVPPSSLSTVTIIVWKHKHAHAHARTHRPIYLAPTHTHTHNHTGNSCTLTFKSGPLLTVTYCHPTTQREALGNGDGHTNTLSQWRGLSCLCPPEQETGTGTEETGRMNERYGDSQRWSEVKLYGDERDECDEGERGCGWEIFQSGA